MGFVGFSLAGRVAIMDYGRLEPPWMERRVHAKCETDNAGCADAFLHSHGCHYLDVKRSGTHFD